MQRPDTDHSGDIDSLASVDLAPYMGVNNSIRTNGYTSAKNKRRFKSTENVVSSFQMTFSLSVLSARYFLKPYFFSSDSAMFLTVKINVNFIMTVV